MLNPYYDDERRDRHVEYLEEQLASLQDELADMEKFVKRADEALCKAWELLGPDEREELRNADEYADEFFWDEPRRED